MKRFLDEGFDDKWLHDPIDLSRAAVFGEADMAAYSFLVKHWLANRKVPSVGYFQHAFPAETYRLPKDTDLDLGELIAMASENRYRCQLDVYGGDFIDLIEEGRYTDAQQVLQEAAQIRYSNEARSIYLVWDSADYDVEGRINREFSVGVRTGIPEIDEDFAGWQPGDVVCYLGRPKAGKTSFFLLSALQTWEGTDETDAKRVLFVSVEIAAGNDTSRPGIADRLDAFAAKVDFMDYAKGLKFDPRTADKIRAEKKRRGNEGDLIIIQPQGEYTVVDLENDIERFEPEVVYVDGFYLMTDHRSGKSGGDWQGQDNLARDLKFMSMRKNVVTLISHQVRGKQLANKKKDIDADAMMGGTSILMWATTVMGINIDDETHTTHTINCLISRIGYLPTIHGKWDWKTCKFTIVEEPEEAEYEGDMGHV